ncbi:MAG: hypothetical protein KJO17_00705 [Acidimicrobiia bacterium]|nr:hypothetical protein [Acidimicrobiia bacterium]
MNRFSVRHLFVVVPVLGVVVAAARSITDNSFLWHVRAGTIQLDAGEVLRADPFSFTAAGESWRTQSWIADLGYGLLERTFDGLGWVWPVVAVTMALTLTLVGIAAYREAPNPLVTAGVVFFVGWLLLRTLVPRPVVFSHLLLAALVVALTRRRTWWAIPLLLWAWAGIHGSFIIGLGLLVLEALRTGRRELAGVAGLSAVTVSLTAHGLALWGILLRFAENRGALDLIQEWAPPDLTDLSVAPYALFIVLIILGAARGRIEPRDLILVVPFLLFGLTSFRALIPAVLVLAPWVARTVAFPAAARREEAGGLNVAIAVVLLGVAVWAGLLRAGTEPDDELFPVAAAAALKDGPVFHGDAVGGYLIWAEWPGRLVYTDDRAELYGAERFEQFADTRAGLPLWREVFERYGITQALLSADQSGLQEVLAASGWAERYRDDEYVLLSETG